MSSTIEGINNNISIKLDCLRALSQIIKDKYENETHIYAEVEELLNNYDLETINILSDYYNLLNLQKNKDSSEQQRHDFNEQKDIIYKEYQLIIKKEDFAGKIDNFFRKIKNMLDVKIIQNEFYNNQLLDNNDIAQIKALFLKFESYFIGKNVSTSNYNICELCENPMRPMLYSGEIICTHCGAQKILYGTIFEDEQADQKNKHGSYDPAKHCRFWLERIQARESKEIPQKVINDVKRCIKKNKIIDVENITCEQIRKYLSQTKNSSFNEHIPLIRKLITGKTPTQISDDEKQYITVYFTKIIKAHEEIKPDNKTNVSYHPYFIYKIIEHMMRNNKRRRNGILSCIHLQSRETLIDNDKMWKQICEIIKDIPYIPTDKSITYEQT